MSYVNAYAPRIKLPPSNNGKVVGPVRAGKFENPSVSYVGICLSCGEPFYGPRAIRLMQGGVQRIDNENVQFHVENFHDGTRVQWLCPGCSSEHNIVRDDEFLFTPQLRGLAEGWCTLCHQVIEPFPNPQWSTAIKIERGLFQVGKSGAEVFAPTEGGHLHFICMDDLGLELWRLLDPNDSPSLEAPEPEIDDWEWSDDSQMWYSASSRQFYNEETGEYWGEDEE